MVLLRPRALPIALLAMGATALLREHLADMPLSMWPILQTHDTGTVYLHAADPIDEIIYRFTRTQNANNVTSLLDCGTRAFDWRPELNNGTLGFFHGPVFINHSMQAAAQEVVAWANAHSAQQEDALVLVMSADCGGDCAAAAQAAFLAVGMPVLSGTAGCAVASDFTLQSAMTASQLAGGGHAIALINCPSSSTNTYDPDLSCTGFLGLDASEAKAQQARFGAAWRDCRAAAAHEHALRSCLHERLDLPLPAAPGCPELPDVYACYTDALCGVNASYAFNRLKAYNAQVTAIKPPTAPGQRGLLTSIQGCWAQNDVSTVLSFLYNSSLVEDDTRADFNLVALPQWLDATAPRALQYVNLVGMNAVCDNGPAVAALLKQRLPGPAEPKDW